MKGMSTVRTDLRGIIQLKHAIFGIHDTKAWSKPGGRATVPKVAALVKNTYFYQSLPAKRHLQADWLVISGTPPSSR